MSTDAYQPLDLNTARHRQLLLTYDFPPMAGGIARLTGELAKRYPPGSLLISTGSYEKSAAVDAQLPNRVDRLGMRSSRLRTVQGLMLWSHRAAQLARAFRPGFVWCGNLKPAGFPALWLSGREGIPYGIVLYGIRAAPAAAADRCLPLQAGRSRAGISPRRGPGGHQ